MKLSNATLAAVLVLSMAAVGLAQERQGRARDRSPAADPDAFSVLAYNIYMRPVDFFKNGQFIRAGLLPSQLHGYDAIVFSEAADDDVRAKLLEGLSAEYPRVTPILGKDRGIEQDGGVIIVSRWPIVDTDQDLFGDVCSGSDCLADKGVLYAKIDRGGRSYHVFGSHTNAEPTAVAQGVRAKQFAIIKSFVDRQAIPGTEPVIIAGDLNVDKRRFPGEFEEMLRILDAEHPTEAGHPYTYDPATNRMATKGAPSEYLDYVLWSRAHRRPDETVNETQMVRSSEPWKEFAWEDEITDLSDHYGVAGRFRFGQLIGQLPNTPPPVVRYLYAVKPNGELLAYAHYAVEDPNAPRPQDELAETSVRPHVEAPPPPGVLVPSEPAPSGVAVGRRKIPGMAVEQPPATSAAVVTAPVDTATVTKPKPRPPQITQHRLDLLGRPATGWQQYAAVVPGGAAGGASGNGTVLYGLTGAGELQWYRHDGFRDGKPSWKGPTRVGEGWNMFTKVVAGGDGVLYAIEPNGTLRWYQHGDASAAMTPPMWSGPTAVASGWQDFTHVFSTGNGVLYGVTSDGRLLWYRHLGHRTGTAEWLGPKEVGSGWMGFERVFSPGEGFIYALTSSGELVWYRHEGYEDGSPTWQSRSGVKLASDWGDVLDATARMMGPPDPGPR